MRVCPKDGCNYAGVIDARRGACYDNLMCLKCKHTWKDPLHQTKFEEWRSSINNLLQLRGEALNNISKMVLTEPCPNPKCGYYIQKAAGCQHMQCSMCRYEFCWTCLGEYPGYRHSEFDNGQVCGQRSLVLGLFLAVWASVIFTKVMQQIQLFTDSVSDFLFTHDLGLLTQTRSATRDSNPLRLVLGPLLLFFVRLFSIMLVISLSFVICVAVITGLNYFRRISEDNPHLTFGQKMVYMQQFGYVLLGSVFCVGYFNSIAMPVVCLSLVFVLSAARAARHNPDPDGGFRLW